MSANAQLDSILAQPRSSPVNRSILRAAASVTAAGIIVKLAAMGKEIVVAGVYGRSDAMDAFLAAFLIPNLLINLIAESMNQALIPTLIRVRLAEGQTCARQLLSNSTVCLCLLLAVASAVMALAARAFFPLIASNFGAAKLDLSVHLFYALLPCVLLGGIASNCTAVLNSRGQFALPALAPALVPVSIVAITLTLHRELGIAALVVSTLAGTAIHASVMAFSLQPHGCGFRFQWHGMREPALAEPTREVARQFVPVLLSSVVASGGLLVDQAMAAMLPAGSVSALVFAGRFVSVAMALLAGSISTALTPAFSTLIAQRDWRGCRDTLATWTRRTALVSAPIAAALIAFARPLVRLTFQHGAFGRSDTAVVASVLAMYAVQIPFYVVSRVDYRFIIAMRRTDLVFYCGALNLALDVVLNIVLMRFMGIAGIALATSLWTVSTWAFLRYWSRRLLSREQGSGTGDR